MAYVIALDQGTTSSRSILYDLSGKELALASEPLPVSFPQSAWVEQDPEQIFQTQLKTLKEVAKGVAAEDVRAIGITNQRETTICWDLNTGQALAPAIVWQCRRSADICQRLRKEGLSKLVQRETGLVIDSYFSAGKILWMLENIQGLKAKAERAEVVFGTVDAWLLYKLTGRFASEPSNASRTMIYSLKSGDWNEELMARFGLRRENLPELLDSDAEFGVTKVLGPEIPITGVLGDQQASLFGHRAFKQGEMKCTFGTGAFLLVNTANDVLHSDDGLISTAAWTSEGQPAFALEGSVFMAGALVQWLRDGLGLLEKSADSERIAKEVEDSAGLVLVPAFVGLGAPYWDEHARGTMFGITRDSKRAHIVRAGLEAVAHQVVDILEGIDSKESLRIDGGMSLNSLFCQILADLSQRKVEVAPKTEMTAFGAASVALVGSGEYRLAQLDECFVAASKDKELRSFQPQIEKNSLIEARVRWKEAVRRSIGWAQSLA